MIAAVFAAGFGAGIWAAGQTQPAPAAPAERVTGIGGVFFKAKDPKTLTPMVSGEAWHRDPGRRQLQDCFCGASVRIQAAKAPRRGACFQRHEDLTPSAAPFMINYRVRNLETLLTQLQRQA